jgi:4-amino-4-deoxy-L-arabinose transferase-like glycosyltransferase
MRIKDFFSNQKVLLAIVLIIASILRLYKLGLIPPSLSPDEASLGYNAYSILKTGRDEYGQLLPIVFKSFGDYKPGLYVYLSVLPVLFFGLNEFAVRFASSFLGIVAIFVVYKIAFQMFADKNKALFASLLLALNPWHIIFSRGAWEVNVALTLTLIGLYFFLKSLKEQKYLIMSAVFFSLTLVTYQGAKLASLILILILTLIYYKKLLKFDTKTIFISLLMGIVISLPIFYSVIRGRAGRLAVFSLFSYPREEEYLNKFLRQGGESKNDLGYYLYHSENLNFVSGIMGRLYNHFSARFLFFEGDWQNPKHSSPNSGMFSYGDILLLFMGVVYLIKAKDNKLKIFIFLWLALSVLPAILSRDEVQAVRSLNMLIPMILILSLGLDYFFKESKKLLKYSFIIVYVILYSFFLDSYFVHMPIHNGFFWDYGYKQIVETVSPIQSNFREIRIQQSYSQPYIYFLFYQKYDPRVFQQNDKLIPGDIVGDVGKVEHLNNIYFGPIDWSLNRGKTDTLFVADTIRIPVEDSSGENFDLVREIKYPNGFLAFRIIKVNK